MTDKQNTELAKGQERVKTPRLPEALVKEAIKAGREAMLAALGPLDTTDAQALAFVLRKGVEAVAPKP